jgi:outer membrane immunogenic protein
LYVGAVGGYIVGAGDSDNIKGALFGGTIGYNHQPVGSNLVYGVEFDAAWTDAGDSASTVVGGTTFSAKIEGQAIATLRGRLGWAFDRTLVYVTGGGALARTEFSAAAIGIGIASGASDTQTHIGYAVGAGVEHAFAPNWSSKLEYFFTDFNSQTYFGFIESGRAELHMVRAGVSYHFGSW